MPLDKELAFYKSNKLDFLKNYRGKFVLIVGERLVGSFDFPETAYAAGIREFGNIPMLIKQVTEQEPVAYMPAFTLGLINAGS